MSSWLFYLNANRPFSWGENILFRGPSYFFYAWLTPPVLIFIEKLRHKTDLFRQHILPHILFGFGFVVIHIFLSLSMLHYFRVWFMDDTRSFSTVVYINKFVLLSSSFDSFFTYATIAAAAYGLSYYRIFSQEKLRSMELESGLAHARLDAIRNKLNPHFLFNALNSVSSMIHSNPDKADEMIVRVSDLLRKVTDDKTDVLIPLAEEIAFTEEYLSVQKIRFENRLVYTFDIPDTLKEIKIPRFLLQPIVENSIKHALEPFNQTCNITITAKSAGTSLTLSVSDNGPGIDENMSYGTGLSIVKARLESVYKDNYSFSLQNRESGGFAAVITIPLVNGVSND